MGKKRPHPNTINPPKSKAPVKSKLSHKATLPKPRVSADKWLIAILVGLAFLINAATISYEYTLDDPYFMQNNPFVSQGLSATPVFFTHAAYYGFLKIMMLRIALCY